MYKILITGLLLIFTVNINTAFSQAPAGGGAPAGGAATGGVGPAGGVGGAPSPLDFPDYIVTPRDDLDQFENSSLKETKTKYRKGQSTLNPKITQKSNAEVNAEIEKRRAEREKAAEEAMAPATGAASQNTGTNDTAGAAAGKSINLNVKGTSNLFRWKDKDGILHVTDDLGTVPPEYRDQAYQSR